jgi:hypothetical protein
MFPNGGYRATPAVTLAPTKSAGLDLTPCAARHVLIASSKERRHDRMRPTEDTPSKTIRPIRKKEYGDDDR